MHWSQLNNCTKSLVYNSLHYILQNIRTGSISKSDILLLPLSVIYDLKFWLHYADQIKSVPFDYILNQPSVTIYAATDASSKAGGYIVDGVYSFYDFVGDHLDWDINLKEAHVVLCMIEANADLLTGKCVRLYIDNESCFYSMKRKWSKSHSLMMFIYELSHLLMKYRILMYFDWIPSAFNHFADALSRNRLDLFKKMCNTFKLKFDYQFYHYYNNFIFSHDKTVHFGKDEIEYAAFCDWMHQSIDYKQKYPYKYHLSY